MAMIEVRRFLGIASYYSRFIDGVSLISNPLTKWTQNNVTFKWGDDYEWNFQELKRRLTSAPILTIPNDNVWFVVYTRASWKDLDYILMQDGKVIPFVSRQLKNYEQNYSNSWFEINSKYFCSKDLEKLFIWTNIWNLYWSQEIEMLML